MKIAFTGKGGRGKSTLAALFVGYLRHTGQRVLAVDTDVNVHLAALLGVEADAASALSDPDNVTSIRRHLLGANPLVGRVDRFVATTPPGPGSRLVTPDAGEAVLAGTPPPSTTAPMSSTWAPTSRTTSEPAATDLGIRRSEPNRPVARM